MSRPECSFKVHLDATNPGHVVACCGLLELAHRQWAGAEGWFKGSEFTTAVPGECHGRALRQLVETLAGCQISGLSAQDRVKRDNLEREGRELKKQGKELPPDKEKRRKELGEQARAGMIRIEGPFSLILDWWQTGDEEATPKTWAGLQELHKIARAAEDALSGIRDLAKLLDYGCVLRMPNEYRKGKSDHKKPVEPFYFDARRFAHPLGTGFSLDVQEAETIAHPAVELLCLIGLQRFRPATTPGENERGALLDPWRTTSDKMLERYVKDGRAWCTVTPVILPGFDDGKRAKAEKLLMAALRQADLPLDALAELTMRKAPFWPGSQHPRQYFVPDYLRHLPGWHVRLAFREPVPGPLAIGAGRHAGLGILARSDGE